MMQRSCSVCGRPAATAIRRIVSGEPPRTGYLCELHAAQAGGHRPSFGGRPRLLLERTTRRMHAQDLEVEFTDEAIEFLAEEDFDPEFGARPLRRTIQRRVDNQLSRMILDGSLSPGDRVAVGAGDGQLTFEVLEGSAAGVAGEAQ